VAARKPHQGPFRSLVAQACAPPGRRVTVDDFPARIGKRFEPRGWHASPCRYHWAP